MKYLAILVMLLTISTVSTAQMSKEPAMAMPPARTAAPQAPPKSYPDSTKFAAAFKELLPLIKPSQTVRERTLQAFLQMSRQFKARGVDSLVAYDSVMKKVDEKQDERILFDAYRKEFTADELKSITDFMKGPAGKHFLEVEPKLNNAKGQLSSSIQRSVSSTIGPMMKPIERPAGAPPLGGAAGRRPIPGRDSLGHPLPGRAQMTPPAGTPAPVPPTPQHK